MTAAPPRCIFTVSTGRCGQNSLADFLRDHVPSAYVAFEEPQVRPRLPGVLGDVERHVRRRFVETNELLGRGDVLRAFEEGDERALERFAEARHRWIETRLAKSGSGIYVDVSKHFIHGFHEKLPERIPGIGLIRLTRDPIENMRSYLNRGKSFFRDNNRPDSPRNCLRLPVDGLTPGELYLWIWCETQLRFHRVREQHGIDRVFSLTTPDLNDAGTMGRLLDHFGLPHTPVRVGAARNTNAELGYGETRVSAEDVVTFERFLSRIPAEVLARIDLLRGYDPRTGLGGRTAASAASARSPIGGA